MITIFHELNRRLQGIDAESLVAFALESSEQDLFDETRSRLYDRGQDANNVAITPPYAASTVKKKQKQGLPSNRVTLYETGQLHASLKFKKESDGVTIDYVPLYGKFVKDRYGIDVLNPSIANNRDLLIAKMIQQLKSTI